MGCLWIGIAVRTATQHSWTVRIQGFSQGFIGFKGMGETPIVMSLKSNVKTLIQLVVLPGPGRKQRRAADVMI